MLPTAYTVAKEMKLQAFQEVIRGMEAILDALDQDVIPNDDYDISTIDTYCRSLVSGQRSKISRNDGMSLVAGSWCVTPSINNMPSDARVEFIMIPTYLAVAILVKIKTKFPKIADEIEGFEEALRSGMEFASLRGFRGHGYESEEGIIDAIRIFQKGKVIGFVEGNPEFAPRFYQAIQEVRGYLVTNLAQGTTENPWGEDYHDRFNEILNTSFNQGGGKINAQKNIESDDDENH